MTGYFQKLLVTVNFFLLKPWAAFKSRRINLQLFAGDDKTEKATPKKRKDARKKGQVLQSREVTAALVLVFIFIAVRIFGGNAYKEITAFTKRIFSDYSTVDDMYTVSRLVSLFGDIMGVLVKTIGPIFAIALIMGLAAEYAQVGFLFTVETLGLKLDRINPLNGMKRIFSMRAAVELLKSTIKIAIVGLIAYSYLKNEAVNILNLMSMDLVNIAAYIGITTINVAIRICVALLILGVLDYGYQWFEYEKSLKMTKQEIKEEYKQTEGNPEIKSKIKQKQRQISMRRMLQDVPKADVVITNPTHFAVAVKYDGKAADAPVVLAKGQDFIALRIKEIARENGVEIVENKPLARSLYETVEIGQSIPPDLYQAVAEVLAFVYSLKGKGRAG
ncbi:MAG: flagellar biosynthesis protein FlhB [Clostridiales bacterium]|jgi:flagellar biosynthetic protein FlhB|nr:flagellar biosynthesis protein FlhB [Eubacteriales bacterium]MDH7565016.1 flagellar biosynthesis protein FlhB [Clostridiales bacterium]